MKNFFNCLLVGKAGTGKSSYGNFSLGLENAFEVSEDAESCTKSTPDLQVSKGSDKIHIEKMSFAKALNPIEDIRENCNLKYKKVEEEIYVRQNEIVEGDYIVTYTKKYRRKKYTDYNDNISYSNEELLSTETSYRSVPVRVRTCLYNTRIEDK